MTGKAKAKAKAAQTGLPKEKAKAKAKVARLVVKADGLNVEYATSAECKDTLPEIAQHWQLQSLEHRQCRRQEQSKLSRQDRCRPLRC